MTPAPRPGADGTVTFTSIFPAAYSGRWPHLHLEVYESRNAATGGGTRVPTSQVSTGNTAPDTDGVPAGAPPGAAPSAEG